MVATSTERKSVSESDFFAEIIAAIDYADNPIETNQDADLIGRLNRMIAVGAAFNVGIDDFQIVGADYLTQSDRDFLTVNKYFVLCTLQQALLAKHLQKHSFSDYVFETSERIAIVTESDCSEFEAVRQITEKWFRELLGII